MQRHNSALAAVVAVPADGLVVVVNEVVLLTALRVWAIADERAVGRGRDEADAVLAQALVGGMKGHRRALPSRTRGACDRGGITSARGPHSDFRRGGGSPPPPSSPLPSSRSGEPSRPRAATMRAPPSRKRGVA